MADDRALQSIDAVGLEGDRMLLTLTLSEPAPEPVVFTVDQPPRLSMDLPDTRLAVAERYKRLNIGATRAVAAAETEGRTRLVLELSQATTHSVRIDGNRIFLTVDSPGAAGPASCRR